MSRPRRTPRPQPPVTLKPPLTLTVTALGDQGDGLAAHGDGWLAIPGAAPGDVVRVRPLPGKGPVRPARLEAVVTAGPARQTPPCPVADRCGGCAVQHLTTAAHDAFKADRVRRALRQHGLDPAVVTNPVSVAGGRRRAGVTVAWGRLGFQQHRGHEVVPLPAPCPALTPAVAAFASAVAADVAALWPAGARGGLMITEADNGLDVVVERATPPDLAAHERLAALGEAHDLARLCWHGAGMAGPEPLQQRRAPVVASGGVSVPLPVGTFLQPSAAGAEALAALVAEALADAPPGPVADLFSGLGTLSLPLAVAGRRVLAFDNDGAAMAALARAAGQSGLGGRVVAETRDLMRNPLDGATLSGLAAVVFDPPRAGAREQAALMAEAGAPARVVAVSCHPASLARDCATLVAAGWDLAQVVPVDQFPWTAHVEAVAVLRRDRNMGR